MKKWSMTVNAVCDHVRRRFLNMNSLIWPLVLLMPSTPQSVVSSLSKTSFRCPHKKKMQGCCFQTYPLWRTSDFFPQKSLYVVWNIAVGTMWIMTHTYSTYSNIGGLYGQTESDHPGADLSLSLCVDPALAEKRERHERDQSFLFGPGPQKRTQMYYGNIW